jgi:hypothetical protein
LNIQVLNMKAESVSLSAHLFASVHYFYLWKHSVNWWNFKKLFGVLRIQISTALATKRLTFWVITSCNWLKVNGRFGGTCHVYLQDQRLSQASNVMKQAASKLHAASLLGLLFDPVDRGDMFFRNIGSSSTDYTTICPRRHVSLLGVYTETGQTNLISVRVRPGPTISTIYKL